MSAKMFSIPKTIKSKKYPDFIRNDKVLLSQDVEKIFPKIGLKNYSGSFKLDEMIFIDTDRLHYLEEIGDFIDDMIINIDDFCRNYGGDQYYYKNQIETYQSARNALNTISEKIKNDKQSFMNKSKNKYTIPFEIKFSSSIRIDNVFGANYKKYNFPIGSNLLLVLDKIRLLHKDFFGMFKGIKNNSFVQLSKNDLKIVFSGSGNKVNWDIATMSMRGIKSCQNWKNHHAKSLVGSLADPYAGIIYIEKIGKDTKYGSKMIRRAVVRYVINKETKKPALLIERIYPHNYDTDLIDYATLSLFLSFISRKTKDKYEIIHTPLCDKNNHANNYIIPISKLVSQLKEQDRSYRDSKIIYKAVA